MMDFLMRDTITAIATPPGEGGIGVIRISGIDALPIAKKIFCPLSKKLDSLTARKVHFGTIIDPETGDKIDEVLLLYMKAPQSYTTQDLIEIDCHGGAVILKRVLEIILKLGARVAEPGEFTKRAFWGGRIDLAQAEAVIDIIRAKTDRARQIAFEQLSGRLSEKINKIQEDIVDFLLQLEVRIDFSEDDITPLCEDYRKDRVSSVIAQIEELLGTFEKGRIYREGIRACISGPPNAGKSTLLNTLLGQERAIVTHIPGTTRDRIEETANIGGVPVTLIDTAGIRKSSDVVEQIGINRAIEAAACSELVVLVIDASSEKIDGFDEITKNLPKDKVIVAANKTDLGIKYNKEEITQNFPAGRIIELSLKTGENINKLESEIQSVITGGQAGSAAEVTLANARHKSALENAKKSLIQAQTSINNGLADDFVTIDLHAALDSIGEITGKIVYEDLLDKIFSEFCIGK